MSIWIWFFLGPLILYLLLRFSYEGQVEALGDWLAKTVKRLRERRDDDER